MDRNLVSATVAPEDKAEFLQCCRRQAEIAAKYAVALTKEGRRNFGMMGDGGREFTLSSHKLVLEHGQHFPPSVDVVEFTNDLNLHLDMREMSRALMSVNEMIADTELAAGYDAYQHALEVYAYAKLLNKVPGLSDLVADMGRWFKRGKGKGQRSAAEGSAANPTG